MKINTNNHNKKLHILIIAVLALACALLACVWLFNWSKIGQSTKPTEATSNPVNTIDYSKPSPSQISTGEDIKKESIAKSSNQAKPDSDASISITSAQVNGSSLSIRTQLTKVSNTGKCSLSVSNSAGKTYSAETEIQAMTSYSTCKGFDVPLTAIETGPWKVIVTYSDETGSTNATREVSL